MKRTHKRKGGFTIIEVVLVLAVAGLIFLVVFAAVPRLQASRRDNQRKRDAEAIHVLATEYFSNTGGYPSSTIMDPAFPGGTTAPTGVFADYINEASLTDPSGSGYERVNPSPFNTPSISQFSSGRDYQCNAARDNIVAGGPGNTFAVVIMLERGFYCIDGNGP